MKIPEHLLQAAYHVDTEKMNFGLFEGGDGTVEDAFALARFLGLATSWNISVDIGGDPVLYLRYDAEAGQLTVEVHANDDAVSVLGETEAKFVLNEVRPEWLADDTWLVKAAHVALDAVTEIHETGESQWAAVQPTAA